MDSNPLNFTLFNIYLLPSSIIKNTLTPFLETGEIAKESLTETSRKPSEL